MAKSEHKATLVQTDVRDHPMKPLDRYHVWGDQLRTIKEGSAESFVCNIILFLLGIGVSTALSRIYSKPQGFSGYLIFWCTIVCSFLLAACLAGYYLKTRKKSDTVYSEIINYEQEDEDISEVSSLEFQKGQQNNPATGPNGKGGAKTTRKLNPPDTEERS